MSDEAANGANTGDNQAAGAAAPTGPQFSVEKIYVKDVSFEVPNAPQVFTEQVQPELQLNLNQRVQRLGDEMFEVVLGVTLTCTAGDKTAYLAEVQQAGLFRLAGFDERNLDAVLGTHCPNVLFPYVRQTTSDLVQAGGFPPFLLQPINFDVLYAEGLRQRAQGAQPQGEADVLAGSEPAGNA